MEATKWIIWHEENRLQRVNILSLQGKKVIFLIVFRPAGKVSLTHLSHVKKPCMTLRTSPDLSIFLVPTGNLATSRARVTAASRSLPPQLGSGRSKVSLSARRAV